MIQLILLSILLLIVIYSVRQWLPTLPEQGRAKALKVMFFIGFMVLLVIVGRSNWILPLIGASIVAGLRLVPYLLPLAAVLRRIVHRSPVDETQQSAQPPPRDGRMGQLEAYEILGLPPGATRQQIVSAHRRLMQKMHPDRGGSDYLAVKINQARDTLLGN